MSPDPVRTTGSASLSLSAPATVTVRVLTAQGALVRSLLAAASKPAGPVSVVWDRKDGAGRRVAKGTYRLQADAVDAAGRPATALVSFGVA